MNLGGISDEGLHLLVSSLGGNSLTSMIALVTNLILEIFVTPKIMFKQDQGDQCRSPGIWF